MSQNIGEVYPEADRKTTAGWARMATDEMQSEFNVIQAHSSQSRNPLAIASWILLHLIVSAAALVCFIPFIWLFCAAFKRGDDLFSSVLLPGDLHRLTLSNFSELFNHESFGWWLINSVFLSSATTVLVVALSSLAGFVLAKYEFRGRGPLMVIMLFTMMIPSQVLLPGTYELIWKLGWVNSYLALLLPGAVSVFGVFLFRQAMTQVPDELLHAARVDGCSEFRIWWEIALPVVRPMVGAFTLLSFIGNWNSFLWPNIVLQDDGKYTLPIGLANLVSQPGSTAGFGPLMAGTLLSLVPITVLFFFLQRDFIAGLSSGAVKG
jgi:ABC-type glycerol-3-phosphate transport system permease component